MDVITNEKDTKWTKINNDTNNNKWLTFLQIGNERVKKKKTANKEAYKK